MLEWGTHYKDWLIKGNFVYFCYFFNSDTDIDHDTLTSARFSFGKTSQLSEKHR